MTLIPVALLFVFGSGSLQDFAFALIVGIASGAYSSIFIASPLLAILLEREPQFQQRRRDERAATPLKADAGARRGRRRAERYRSRPRSRAGAAAHGRTAAPGSHLFGCGAGFAGRRYRSQPCDMGPTARSDSTIW